jgi:hypothetical protein
MQPAARSAGNVCRFAGSVRGRWSSTRERMLTPTSRRRRRTRCPPARRRRSLRPPPDLSGTHCSARGRARVRLLEPGSADRERNEAGRGRLEERIGGSEECGEDDELPKPGRSRQQQHCDRCLHRSADRVGGEHDQLAGEPVCPDTACQNERDQRQGLSSEHEPEIGSGAVEISDHREGESNRDERVAEHGGRLAQPERPELSLAQSVEWAGPVHPIDTTSASLRDAC